MQAIHSCLDVRNVGVGQKSRCEPTDHLLPKVVVCTEGSCTSRDLHYEKVLTLATGTLIIQEGNKHVTKQSELYN